VPRNRRGQSIVSRPAVSQSIGHKTGGSATAADGIPAAKKGFVLLPRRWVVERSFGWAARFRRLAKDDERFSETLVGLHYVAFSLLMLHKAAPLFCWSA
jgi:transposase